MSEAERGYDMFSIKLVVPGHYLSLPHTRVFARPSVGQSSIVNQLAALSGCTPEDLPGENLQRYKHVKPTYCPASGRMSLGKDTESGVKLDHWIFDVAKRECHSRMVARLRLATQSSTRHFLMLFFISRTRGESSGSHLVVEEPLLCHQCRPDYNTIYSCHIFNPSQYITFFGEVRTRRLFSFDPLSFLPRAPDSFATLMHSNRNSVTKILRMLFRVSLLLTWIV